MLATCLGDIERNAASDAEVTTDFGRETIVVSSIVFLGFVYPELIVEDGVDEEGSIHGFERCKGSSIPVESFAR